MKKSSVLSYGLRTYFALLMLCFNKNKHGGPGTLAGEGARLCGKKLEKIVFYHFN